MLNNLKTIGPIDTGPPRSTPPFHTLVTCKVSASSWHPYDLYARKTETTSKCRFLTRLPTCTGRRTAPSAATGVKPTHRGAYIHWPQVWKISSPNLPQLRLPPRDKTLASPPPSGEMKNPQINPLKMRCLPRSTRFVK